MCKVSASEDEEEEVEDAETDSDSLDEGDLSWTSSDLSSNVLVETWSQVPSLVRLAVEAITSHPVAGGGGHVRRRQTASQTVPELEAIDEVLTNAQLRMSKSLRALTQGFVGEFLKKPQVHTGPVRA